jgi:hypothetical protein
MKDKVSMILLGLIALNLTYQSLTMPAVGEVQRVAICDRFSPANCADVSILDGLEIQHGPVQPLKVEICGRSPSASSTECAVVLPNSALVVSDRND